jgi:hypothetical protein
MKQRVMKLMFGDLFCDLLFHNTRIIFLKGVEKEGIVLQHVFIGIIDLQSVTKKKIAIV